MFGPCRPSSCSSVQAREFPTGFASAVWYGLTLNPGLVRSIAEAASAKFVGIGEKGRTENGKVLVYDVAGTPLSLKMTLQLIALPEVSRGEGEYDT